MGHGCDWRGATEFRGDVGVVCGLCVGAHVVGLDSVFPRFRVRQEPCFYLLMLFFLTSGFFFSLSLF